MPKLIDIDVARAYAEERWPSPVVRRHIDALLDGCPKVDVPQIVRCKDCVLWMRVDEYSGRCPFLIGENQRTGPEHYCSCGERRGEDGQD